MTDADRERALEEAMSAWREVHPLSGEIRSSPAWHDLGEILLQDSRFDEAAEAFAHVTELVDTGPKSWLGPWREAEVAAHQGRPEAFEKHMKLALQRGFSFRTIRGLPNWRQFYADPVMGPSVTKLVTVYGTPDILKSLEPEEAP